MFRIDTRFLGIAIGVYPYPSEVCHLGQGNIPLMLAGTIGCLSYDTALIGNEECLYIVVNIPSAQKSYRRDFRAAHARLSRNGLTHPRASESRVSISQCQKKRCRSTHSHPAVFVS